jgi:hypothetical protein
VQGTVQKRADSSACTELQALHSKKKKKIDICVNTTLHLSVILLASSRTMHE